MKIKDVRKAASSEWECHLIDEYAAGRISRRELIQRASVAGMALPFLSLFTGRAVAAAVPAQDASKPGTGKIVVGAITPAGTLNPIFTNNRTDQLVFSLVGDFMSWSSPNLVLQPRIATSWKRNNDASIWTFAIRRGVTFHDGSSLTAKDVAATFRRLANPANKSQALGAFAGVLQSSGVSAVDDYTVRFELEAPNGNFPYLVSSDNYNAIIQPAQAPDNWETTFPGSGPWKLVSYNQTTALTLAKNPKYWRGAPIANSLEVTFFSDVQGQIIALQAGDIDLGTDLPVTQQIAPLASDRNVRLLDIRSTAFPEIHMLTTKPPFNDPRVRKAMALTLNRPQLVAGLLLNRGELGNDSNFSPLYPSTYKGLPQRHEDIHQAKQLLAAAGHSGGGFSVTLTGPQVDEVPELAVLVQNAAQAVGVQLQPEIVAEATYYNQYWLGTPMSITKYLPRAVPNVYLAAGLGTGGSFNAGDYSNPKYDAAVKTYVAATDLQAQRAASKQIETILLNDTPVIIPYFTHYLMAVRQQLVGDVNITTNNQIDVNQAGLAK